jgi:hypothetical protein
MTLGLCLICVTGLGWALATTAARPADEVTRRRDLDRRMRYLRHHPGRANVVDVRNLLLIDSIPATTVDRVLRRSEARRVSADTMWRWADLHGPDKVVLVIDADVAEATLLQHLDAATAPDWDALGLFARLNNDVLPGGMPIDELLDLDVVPALSDLTFSAEITDWTTDAEPGVASSPPDDDWPAAVA